MSPGSTAIYRFADTMSQHEVIPELLEILETLIESLDAEGRNGLAHLLAWADDADPSNVETMIRRFAIPIRLASNRGVAIAIRCILRRHTTKNWIVRRLQRSLTRPAAGATAPPVEFGLEEKT
jgi:hypothetical protein